VRTRIAFDAQRLALVEGGIRPRVEAARRLITAKDAPQAFVVFHQQRAGRGADENLDAGATGRAFQFRQILDVLAGAADEERKSQCMRWRPRLILSEKVASVTVRGSVFGISNTAVTPPITALRDPSQIFLLSLARLAEMHLGVDHAGQDVQALAVDHLRSGCLPEAADRGDPALVMPISRTPSPS